MATSERPSQPQGSWHMEKEWLILCSDDSFRPVNGAEKG